MGECINCWGYCIFKNKNYTFNVKNAKPNIMKIDIDNSIVILIIIYL